MHYLTIILVFLLWVGISSPAYPDSEVKDDTRDTRYYVRDRGQDYKAIVRDDGTKVGYAAKRGKDWAIFLDTDTSLEVEDIHQ